MDSITITNHVIHGQRDKSFFTFVNYFFNESQKQFSTIESFTDIKKSLEHDMQSFGLNKKAPKEWRRSFKGNGNIS